MSSPRPKCDSNLARYIMSSFPYLFLFLFFSFLLAQFSPIIWRSKHQQISIIPLLSPFLFPSNPHNNSLYIYIYIRNIPRTITLHNCRHHFFFLCTLIPAASPKKKGGGESVHTPRFSPTVFLCVLHTQTDTQTNVLTHFCLHSENNTSHTSINGTSSTPLVALNSNSSLV